MSDVLSIESLDLEARGIARRDGKVVFVEGALPGERVSTVTVRRKPSYEIARVEEVLRPSSQRVAPRCPHFGVCGGCAMQHLEPSTQVAIKQRSLEDTFWHVGKLRPARILPPLQGPTWGYRYRARLSVRVVPMSPPVPRRSTSFSLNPVRESEPTSSQLVPAVPAICSSGSALMRLRRASVINTDAIASTTISARMVPQPGRFA